MQMTRKRKCVTWCKNPSQPLNESIFLKIGSVFYTANNSGIWEGVLRIFCGRVIDGSVFLVNVVASLSNLFTKSQRKRALSFSKA